MRVLKKELWPAKIKIKLPDSHVRHISIEDWLGENMGAFKGRWNMVPRYDSVDYYFRNSKDATMFALKWSS